jgi:hypothetical protein
MRASPTSTWLLAAVIAVFAISQAGGSAHAKGLWSALDRLEFSSTSVLLGELVAIMLEKSEVGFPLGTTEWSEIRRSQEKGGKTHFMKCLCFALVSLAVTGDIRLSVGETIL